MIFEIGQNLSQERKINQRKVLALVLSLGILLLCLHASMGSKYQSSNLLSINVVALINEAAKLWKQLFVVDD